MGSEMCIRDSAAAVGLAGFGALLLSARRLGFADAWGYLRTLH